MGKKNDNRGIETNARPNPVNPLTKEAINIIKNAKTRLIGSIGLYFPKDTLINRDITLIC